MKIGQGLNKIPGRDTSIPLYAGIPLENAAENKNQEKEILVPALVDALLGASGEGGYHDLISEKHVDHTGAITLLQEVERHIHYAGWKLNNADITLNLPWGKQKYLKRDKIIDILSQALFADTEQINIKWIPCDENSECYLCHVVVLLTPRAK